MLQTNVNYTVEQIAKAVEIKSQLAKNFDKFTKTQEDESFTCAWSTEPDADGDCNWETFRFFTNGRCQISGNNYHRVKKYIIRTDDGSIEFIN
jgi:hypothetical protein